MKSSKKGFRFTFRASPIVYILTLFLALATLYNATVPLGEGPDEPGHLNYVLFLAREDRLPVQRAAPEPSDVEGEGHQPPLAYLLAVPAVAWLPHDELNISLSANPHFLWNGGNDPAAFMRTSREYWPWRGVTLAWHLARGVSTLLGAVTVYCTWKACRTLAPRRPALALLASAFVAFNPQFLFTSALVTNDTLLAALSAGLFWLCVVWMNDSSESRLYRPILAGVLLGLGLLTKQSALLFVPLLVWASWCAGHGKWRNITIWGGVALLIAGWWYMRNWHLYGDPLGYTAFRAKFLTQSFNWHNPLAWTSAVAQLHASFWARFGWMSLRPAEWVIRVYGTVAVLALLGLAWNVGRTLCAARPNHRASQSKIQTLKSAVASPWMLVALLPLLAFAWTVSFALTAGLVAWQGRMLFPALPALAILLASGLMGGTANAQPALRNSWTPGAGLWPLVAGLALLAVYLPLGVIRPAYVWYPLPPALAQARIETPVHVRFARAWERGVELRGWRLDGAARAGQPITITLTWHALEHIPQDWTVFLHLLDDAGHIVAQDNRRPLGGAFPMPLWTPGDWVEDPHTLWLPLELPPGRYRLSVGLYQPENRGRRLSIRDDDGEIIGDTAQIGAIEVGKSLQTGIFP